LAGPKDAKGLSMSIKLTDTQLVMLSAAAQRDDRCLVPAPKLKGAAAQKIAGKLMAAGLVKEIKAKAGVSVWRRDDEAGISYGLTLTTAGATVSLRGPNWPGSRRSTARETVAPVPLLLSDLC
jgi:hypothetical protein